MPIQAELDTGYAGQSAPLEGADESKASGITATAMGAFIKSPVIGLVYKGMQAAAGGEMVTQKDAQAKMKAQGYDATAIPESGITSGALDVMMQRQSDLRVNGSIAQRANLSSTTRFVSSLAGSLPDPSNAALMAFAPQLKLGEAGLVARAAAGAAEGAGYTAGYVYGSEAINHTLGDQDATSMENLRTILFGGVAGGGLHAAFGGGQPKVTTPGAADLRNSIFTAVQKAEDSTGKGIITHDTGGLTKFGISQKAHPDVDVANLTQESAARIIKTEYWDKIDGDHLSSDIAHTALDAAVNQGVGNAKKWMLDSGGDPKLFNQYREAEYRRLAKENPEKYGKYLDGWLKRLENVKNEPLLAPEQAPRVRSVDQMANNVDSLPAETRNVAGEAAVNQFLHDDEVNVDTVINKSLEEQWGVKPDSDFDPTGEAEAWGINMSREGNGPRSALTIADEHEDHVQSLESEAYRNVADRRLQGTDTDLTKAIPQPNRGIVTANDNARLQTIRETAAKGWAERDAQDAAFAKSLGGTEEGPMTAAAKASAADAVREAKAMHDNTNPVAPKEMQLRVSRKVGDQVKAGKPGQIHAELYSEAELKALKPGQYEKETGFVTPDGQHLDRKAAQKWVEEHQPGVQEKIDEIKAQRGRADKGNDGLMMEPYRMANDLMEDARAKELTEFDEAMKRADEVIKEHEASADAVEAAVRCAMQLGED